MKNALITRNRSLRSLVWLLVLLGGNFYFARCNTCNDVDLTNQYEIDSGADFKPEPGSSQCWNVTACENCIVWISPLLYSGTACSMGTTMKLYDGNVETDEALIASYCKNEDNRNTPRKSTLRNALIVVETRSDAVSKDAVFRFKVFLTAYVKDFTTPANTVERVIVSTNPLEGSLIVRDYQNNLNISEQISAPLGTNLILEIFYGQIEYCGECQCDYFATYNIDENGLSVPIDGAGTSPIVCNFSPLPVQKKTAKNQALVNLFTDSTVTKELLGYPLLRINFLEVVPEVISDGHNYCKREPTLTKNGRRGVLVFEADENYDNNMNCKWRVEVAKGFIIRYTMQILWLEQCEPCGLCDYVAFQSGDPNSYYTYCSTTVRLYSRTSESNWLDVSFISDASINSSPDVNTTGFRLDFEQINAPHTYCDGKVIEVDASEPSSFTNLEYPNLYNEDVDCQWRIEVANTSTIKLNVEVTWIDACADNNGCGECSYISIYDGKFAPENRLTTICERNLTVADLKTTSNVAIIHFASGYTFSQDAELRADRGEPFGFKVYFEEVKPKEVDKPGARTAFIITYSVLGSVMVLIMLGVTIYCYIEKRKIVGKNSQNGAASSSNVAETTL